MKGKDLGYIITDYVNSKGDNVSPKKLQKLLYYIEAWHLVHLDESLIDEDFEAWVHGPVIPSLYGELKQYGFNDIRVINDELDAADIRIDENIRKNKLSENQQDLIFSVLNKYGMLNSFQLEMLTHSESPWIDARKGYGPNERCRVIISKDSIKSFYKDQIS